MDKYLHLNWVPLPLIFWSYKHSLEKHTAAWRMCTSTSVPSKALSVNWKLRQCNPISRKKMMAMYACANHRYVGAASLTRLSPQTLTSPSQFLLYSRNYCYRCSRNRQTRNVNLGHNKRFLLSTSNPHGHCLSLSIHPIYLQITGTREVMWNCLSSDIKDNKYNCGKRQLVLQR